MKLILITVGNEGELRLDFGENSSLDDALPASWRYFECLSVPAISAATLRMPSGRFGPNPASTCPA